MPKISDLLDASTLAGDELVYVLQSGQDRRSTVANLLSGLALPWQSGLVRISTYLVINGSSAVGGTVTPSVHWNDGVADNNGIGPAAAAPTVGSVSQSVFLAHTAAAAINYQVDITGVTSGVTRFDLYITVERLT